MNEKAVQEELSRLRNQLKVSGEEADKKVLDLRVELDRLKIEIVALKGFLSSANPSFSEEFPRILARTIEEVNPEFE